MSSTGCWVWQHADSIPINTTLNHHSLIVPSTFQSSQLFEKPISSQSLLQAPNQPPYCTRLENLVRACKSEWVNNLVLCSLTADWVPAPSLPSTNCRTILFCHQQFPSPPLTPYWRAKGTHQKIPDQRAVVRNFPGKSCPKKQLASCRSQIQGACFLPLVKGFWADCCWREQE